MKKSYSLIALAIAMGMSASAATPVKQMAKLQDAKVMQLDATKMVGSTMKKAPAMHAPSTDKICDGYTMKYAWLLNSNDPMGGILPGIKITKVDDKNVLVSIPYFTDNEFEATYDSKTGKLTIPGGQDCFFNTNYNEMVTLEFERFQLHEDDSITMEETLPAIEGQVHSDGTITFPDWQGFALRVTEGYFFLGIMVQWDAPKYFNYDDYSWEKKTTVQFTDDCLNYLINPEYRITDPVTVDLYYNASSALYALDNPYHQGGWAQINQGTEKGYIVFNMTDPTCVVMRPATNSGLAFPESQENPTLEYYYPYNKEGRYYFEYGWELEDIYMDLAAVEDPISNWDEATKTVTIYNCYFGITGDATASYWFGADQPLGYTFVFDSIEGIDAIAVDAEAPVKYYNLQGMEVVNPVKGQVVIKTQGKKAQKVVF